MSKAGALHAYMSGFGLTAYDESNVPANADLPYLTYTYATGEFNGGEVSMVVNLWYRTESNAVPNAKVEEIYSAIGRGGVTIPVDGGVIWIKRGSPFAQSLTDPSDANIRRRYINLIAEYITA